MTDEEEPAARVRIDYHSGERVYLQIVRIIRDMIISGELPVGAQIPSGARMKREWGVNRLTGAMAVEITRFDLRELIDDNLTRLGIDRPVELEVLATDQMAWSSALTEIPNPSVLAIVDVHPIGSRVLLTSGFDSLLRMVDRLLVGSGNAPAEERPLTEIEQ